MARAYLSATSQQLRQLKPQLLHANKKFKQRRAWRLKIAYNQRVKFEIIFRRFKSNRLRQSIFKKQLVVPFYYFGLKEIAVEWRPRNHRFLPLARPALGISQVAIAAIVLGIAGSVYFSTHLHTAENLEPTAP